MSNDPRKSAIAAIGATIEELGIEESTSENTRLLGSEGVVDSMGLVQVCLALEDLASEADRSFDWTSDHAMSRSRGMFQSVGSMADEFVRQTGSQGKDAG